MNSVHYTRYDTKDLVMYGVNCTDSVSSLSVSCSRLTWAFEGFSGCTGDTRIGGDEGLGLE